MSGTGGVRADQGSAVHNLPPSQAPGKAGQAQSAEHVGRGFSSKNSISHQKKGGVAHASANRDRVVKLPPPRVDPAQVATPELIAQISQSSDTTELAFTFDDILTELSSEEASDSGSSTAGLFGSTRQKQGGRSGGDSSGQQSGQQQQELASSVASAGKPGATEGVEETNGLVALQQETTEVFDKILAIKSAPPEVMEELKAASHQLSAAVLNGDIEDIARMLSEIQTKLQDTRIKFDEQAIRASRLKRQMISQERVQKLSKALEKMKEAEKKALIGKIFGGIATALMVAVAAVTIATGVGAKAGLMLIMAATIMVTMTVSQNTGDWMTNLGGAIKDDKAQLAIGISWAVLAAALSFGAGFAGGSSKAAADTATTTVQQTAHASAQTAQQSANASAQVAQQSANATAQTAQQTAQQSATAVQQTSKAAAKAATDVADDAADQATKVAVKSAQQSAKETAKTSADATKEATKETTKQLAEISKKEMYFRRAAHIGKFTQGAATGAEGGAQIDSTITRYKGEMYQAEATDKLADITGLNQFMEDWQEAITRVLQEIQEGQQIASDMLSQAQQSKFTITRNI